MHDYYVGTLAVLSLGRRSRPGPPTWSEAKFITPTSEETIPGHPEGVPRLWPRQHLGHGVRRPSVHRDVGRVPGTIGFNDVLTIPLSFSNVSSVPVVLGNPCGTPPPDLCIEQAIYSTTVTLPANAYGWDLMWQRCCRNPSISNLQNFGGTENPGATFLTHVPGTTAKGPAPPTTVRPSSKSCPLWRCAPTSTSPGTTARLTRTETNSCIPSVHPLDGGGTGGGNGIDSPSPTLLPPHLTTTCRT